MCTKEKFNPRILATVLALALLMTLMPVSALASNPVTVVTVDLYFGDPDYDPVPPESLMDFVRQGTGTDPYTYLADYCGPDAAAFYPDRLLLVIRSTGEDEVTLSNIYTSYVTANYVVNGVYDLQIGDDENPYMTFTAYADNTYQNIRINFKQPKDVHAPGAGLYAYLPAAGQFTNEQITAGGWGDAFASDGETLKLGGNPTGTGISLGAFGGYVVYKFDDSVANSAYNPYGADFIIYGNAFWGNSEAGCIQVAQADENGDPDTWYDIAGSLYYKDDTIRDYAITYTIPNGNKPENTGTTIPVSPSTRYDVPYEYTYTGGSGSGTLASNGFHNHCYYPFHANYFLERGEYSGLARPWEFPFVDYTYNQSTGESTVEFTGIKLANVTNDPTSGANTATNLYQFGYCDVHPNVTSNPDYNKAYNPYVYNATSTAYNTTAAGTGGGDPIDISWAVDAEGKPVYLPDIQYVRIYTGLLFVHNAFGEISTEVLGVKAVTGEEDPVGTTADPTVTVGGNGVTPGTTAVTIPTVNIEAGVPTAVQVNSSNGYIVFINEATGTTILSKNFTLEADEEQMVRIIVQNSTNQPYIGYIKLVGAE